MEKTQAYVPVVGESDSLLADPLRIHRIGGIQTRQIARRVLPAAVAGFEQQFGRIALIALHRPAVSLVISVDLRSIPPCSDLVRRRSRRARHVGIFAEVKRRRRDLFSDQAFIDPILRAAAEPFGFFVCLAMVFTPHRHHYRLVMSFLRWENQS
jgi:hypothetical protein